MTQMIRKQIYLQKRQDVLLKKLARLRQVSEAELIREAIDQQIGQATVRPALPDPEAWEKARKFMLELRKRGPIPNRSRAWTRQDAYEHRMSRYDRRSH